MKKYLLFFSLILAFTIQTQAQDREIITYDTIVDVSIIKRTIIQKKVIDANGNEEILPTETREETTSSKQIIYKDKNPQNTELQLVEEQITSPALPSTIPPSADIKGGTGIIQGRVFNAINNEPIMFANVVIEGTSVGATTDLDGNYAITGLAPELYNIQVSYIGFEEKTLYEIQVSNSRPTAADFALEEASTALEEVVVRASPFKKTEESPVSLRTIGVAEIQRNPGGARDISRVVQSLPGVTSTASFRNDLLIRGGAPNENRFYLDDVEVPNINHFATQGASGGPVGLINVDFIREVDFFSGAFPANRGNALSSVFNFKQKDGRSDRLGVTATIGASDTGITLEGPIGKKTTFLASARQSYLQLLFQAIGLPFLPTYNDFQVKTKTRFDQKNELTFIGLGAIDNFSLNLDRGFSRLVDIEDPTQEDLDAVESEQYLLDNLPVNEQWNYTNGLVYKRYAENGYWTFVLSRNMLNNTATKYENNIETDDNLILNYKSQEIENKFRIEHTTRFNGFKLTYGTNYEFAKYNNKTFNRVSTPVGPLTIDYAADFSFHKYGLFGQISKKFVEDKLVLSLGVRTDANSYSDEMSNPLEQISPRFSLAYALTERLSINLNSGIYYQLPPYTVMGYKDENGTLINRENGVSYIRNTHAVAGLELNTAKDSKITLEGFYKLYDNYPFLLRDSINLANLGGDFGVIGNEPTASDKQGRTYGLEFLFQQRLYKGFYGIVSYTLGWSEFENKNGDFVPSSWDSRHTVNLTGGKRFNKNWEVGLNWRLQSGLPFTPFDVERSSLIENWSVRGVGLFDWERLNTERYKAIHTLDVRVDKKWFFKRWSLNLYLDVENVYGNSIAQDILLLDRDEAGNPQIDPNNPAAFQTKFLTSGLGTTLPTIGVVVAF